jgi:hypothetical protein
VRVKNAWWLGLSTHLLGSESGWGQLTIAGDARNMPAHVNNRWWGFEKAHEGQMQSVVFKDVP